MNLTFCSIFFLNVSCTDVSLTIRNTFLNLDEDFGHPLRLVKSAPCVLHSQLKSGIQSKSISEITQTKSEPNFDRNIKSIPKESGVHIVHKSQANVEEEETLIQDAIDEAQADNSYKPSKDFEQEATVLFNKLLQKYYEVMGLTKKLIRELKDATKRWNKIKDKQRRAICQQVREENTKIDVLQEGLVAMYIQHEDLNQRIETHLSLPASSPDVIHSKYLEMLRVRGEIKQLDSEKNIALIKLNNVNGVTQELLDAAFDYYQMLAHKYDQLSRSLALRKGILQKAVDVWESASNKERKIIWERNIALSDVTGLVDEIVLHEQVNDVLHERLLKHMEWCEKADLKIDDTLNTIIEKQKDAQSLCENQSNEITLLEAKLETLVVMHPMEGV